MRVKQEIKEEEFLDIYQKEITDDIVKKYMDKDPFFNMVYFFATKKKIISKILKDDNSIKELFREEIRNEIVREVINFCFKKIEEQDYIVAKMVVSPIVKVIMMSIKDNHGNLIMTDKNHFWTAEVKVEQKAKTILFLSQYFEKKKEIKYQIYI